MEQLSKLLWLCLIAILIMFMVIKFEYSLDWNKKNDQVPFCAVINSNFHIENIDEFQDGKKLFKENCAQCHAKNMKTDATGPALGESIKYWTNDTLNLLNYINDSNKYFSQLENIRLSTVRKNYGGIEFSHKNNFTKNDVIALIKYIN